MDAKKDVTTPEIKRPVGYAINYIADVGNGQQFQVTGSLPLNATLEEFKSEFNKLRSAGEQQRSRSVIPNLEAGIAEAKMAIKRAEDSLTIVDGKAEGRKLAGNETAQREQLVTSIKHDRELLAHKEEVLAKAKADLEG